MTASSAWHGVHRSDSVSSARSLSPARRGRLKNGNRSGDFLAAPRCGARTRCGGECRQPAMPNGRCRLHGGLSTGPRTPAGLARSRRSRWKHGVRSAQVRILLREAGLQSRRTRALRARLTGSSAGHGVHRSDSARSLPATVAPKQGAHAGAPLRKQPAGRPSSAGHGVHRPDSISRKDAQRQSNGTAPTSASLRLRVQSSARAAGLAAGHGVHRSFRDRLRSSASAAAAGRARSTRSSAI
jgi:hypothetical protein